MKKHSIFLLLTLILILSPIAVIAIPPFPTEFYGQVVAFNVLAGRSTLIEAYDNNDVFCGSFSVRTTGYYGVLSCLGDDTSTIEDEGGINNENITFYINGQRASTFGNNNWEEGSYHYVDLVIPFVRCGDGFCDLRETCLSCEVDCGLCSGDISGDDATGNQTGEGGGGSSDQTGEGTGGDGSSGSGTTSSTGTDTSGSAGDLEGSLDGATGAATASFDGTGAFEQGMYLEEEAAKLGCEENWNCINWSICGSNGLQTRDCVDLNDCGTFEHKPAETQECIYISSDKPSCYDGIQNQGETGVDCGGPCLSCSDRVFGDRIIELPKLICKKELNPLKNKTFPLFLLISAIIILKVMDNHRKIQKLKENKKKLSDLKRAKKIFRLKRQTHLFVGLVVLITLILYFFYVFFFLCEPNMTALWILIFCLLITPFTIHLIIKAFEYDDRKRLLKQEELIDTHYNQIQELIRIENEHLAEIEKELAEKIFSIYKDDRFKELLVEYPTFDALYTQIVDLYKDYEDKKVLFEDEKLVCDEIYALANNESFKDLMEQYPDIKIIYNKLLLLYEHYENKQELYDDLVKAENEAKKKIVLPDNESDESNESLKEDDSEEETSE
ncbi:MAG: hypothetical protein KKH40_01760 [Nanoarchaeota archaeon]|nr:hypothetical protein [Nanoarchaeota archaeon]